jgi:hypothetical protein
VMDAFRSFLESLDGASVENLTKEHATKDSVEEEFSEEGSPSTKRYIEDANAIIEAQPGYVKNGK